ncbi:MAG: UDP-N-acetylmuramoyl-L-alanine--D-glutamate ligase [Anaerolineales bacterium]
MTEWKDKHVIVIGAARQGIALGRFLALHGARVIINDQKTSKQLETASKSMNDLDEQVASRIEWFLGSHPLSLLDGIDLMCVSGGVPLNLPLIQEANCRGIPLSNDSQIFLEECPCCTIGITGSAGKTTTTSLVGKIAETAINSSPDGQSPYRKVWVGGNIGTPLLAVVDEMNANDLAVMELSSFQLELMTKSVNIACVLNITPNHLDRHGTMAAYVAAKRRIFDYQTDHDTSVLGRDDPGAWSLLERVRGRRCMFGVDMPVGGMQGAFVDDEWVCLSDAKTVTRILRQAEIPLRGWHNVENVLAACTISQASGFTAKAMREAIISFTGVPHRLEWVHFWKGADWFNDSIATAPERVMAAIHSFDSPADIHRPIVLLAGGRDKNLPWNELANLIHARVDHLILFGEAAGKIASAVGNNKPGAHPFTVESCNGLEQAVEVAAREVEPGDIVLLSPGGTSFDEFRDFEERGEAFKRWVLNLSCM